MTDDFIALDLEWDPEEDDRIICLGLETETVRMVLQPHEFTQPLFDVLASDIPKTAHSTADAKVLHKAGIKLGGSYHDTMVMPWLLNEDMSLKLDDLIKSALGYDPDKRIKRGDNKAMFRCDDGTWVPVGQAPIDQVVAYNGRDVKGQHALYKTVRQELQDEGLWEFYLEEIVPYTMSLITMEREGLPINIEDSEKLRVEVEADAERDANALMSSAGLPSAFKLNTPEHISSFLFKDEFDLKVSYRMGDPPPDLDRAESIDEKKVWATAVYKVQGLGLSSAGLEKTKGRLDKKTGKRVGIRPQVTTPVLMRHLAKVPWVLELIAWRKLDKLLSTYLRKFPQIAVEVGAEAGDPAPGQPKRPTSTRIYGRFKQTGTKTGRLSSADPNLQNIPSRGELGHKVRDLFQGLLVVGDYAQLEPRIQAHYSQDPVLLDIFHNNRDLYLIVAEGIWKEPVEKDDDRRGTSKVAYLGSQYGAGADQLATILALNGYPTEVEEAQMYQDAMRELFWVLEDYKDMCNKQAHRDGYVETIGGRRRHVGRGLSSNSYEEMRRAERQAWNAKIQGSAADIMRRTTVEYFRSGLWRAMPLIADVHDEKIWECKDPSMFGSEYVLKYLQVLGEQGHGYRLDVPLVFEPAFGRSWAKAKAGEGIDLLGMFEGEAA